MNKYVYHGTSIGGIKVLKPNVSTHLKPYVYATTNKVIALLFMSHSNGDLDTVISGCGTVNNPCVLVERWNGAFNKRYNKPGYLYELNSNNFKKEDGLWEPEVVSEVEEKVIKEVYISCIFDELIKHSKKGEIKLFMYPDRPSYIPVDNSDLIERYANFEKSGIKGALKDVLNVYPEFESEIYDKMGVSKPETLYRVVSNEKISKEVQTLSNGRRSIIINGYIAYDNIINAIVAAKPFIRDNGWISYNIVNDKFVFNKGSFDLSKKVYLYKISREEFVRVNSNELYSIKKPHIVSKEEINLLKYI